MVPKDLDKLIEKYLEGNCTEAERTVVESFYASLGGAAPGQASGMSSHDDQLRADRMLTKIVARTQDVENDDHRSHSWRYAGVAAALAFVLLAAYYFFKPAPLPQTSASAESVSGAFTVAENTTASSKRVILPDGSIVQMSPRSEIRYASTSNGAARELFLDGEAYFDVAHNAARPFYVYAGNVVTKVLGTSFIVRARGDDEKVTVSVKTGKVSVYSRKTAHKKTVLTPNQEAIYDNATDLVATQEAAVLTSDQSGPVLTEMHFEETPIPHVLDMLSKTYSIEIVFEENSLAGCVLTSSFYEEGLYDRIDVICTAIGASYAIADARIFIESKGCNLKSE